MTSDLSSLPATAAETTAETPWPVRVLSPKIGDYISKMSEVWVEGQAINVKTWKDLVFLTLRDTEENMSLRITVPRNLVTAMGSPLEDGARVVVCTKPSWWLKNGDLQLMGRSIQSVGLGDLLARIEALKAALAEEGLFDADRKLPLPYVPNLVGLVCATQGDAEHDVVENATKRWPGVRFEIRRVTVQGKQAVPEVTAAIAELDAHKDVDVIVVARGGGSLEDLLPFSDERLVRAVAACSTPLVSAIGHEKDSPLLDLVADYRASTPTDAGKRIVPDAAAEAEYLDYARYAMSNALSSLVERQSERLSLLTSRPVMANPLQLLTPYEQELALLTERSGRALVNQLTAIENEVNQYAVALRTLGPHATLARGYAVVRTGSGHIINDAATVETGDALRITVANGEIAATAN